MILPQKNLTIRPQKSLMIRQQKIRRDRLQETDRAREARRMENRPELRRAQEAQALTVRRRPEIQQEQFRRQRA